MSRQRLPQTTDADTAEAASDSPSLAKGSPGSKARQLPASPGVVTAKGAVGETRLSEIVDAIVDELRPHRRPKKEVQDSVRGLIERLPTEVAELKWRLGVTKFKGKLKETPADALKHLKKLGKCARELEMLLLTMPNRIAWVLEMRGGMSYPTTPETRILIPAPVEHPGRKLMNFISDLGRLQTNAKIAERHLGPSPLCDVEKHLSAKYARFLIVALSKKPPSAHPLDPLRTIAGLLFEVITGKKDTDLERPCKRELKAAAGPRSPTRR
jgi:hypothetical protein